MALEIKVPVLPESVSEAIVSKWNFKVGDFVRQDDVLVDIETDKVILEVAATSSGVLKDIRATEGSKVKAHETLGFLQPQEKANAQEDIPKKEACESQTDLSEELALRPSARKALRDHPIDPNQLIAISQKGPVTQEAIEKALSVSSNEVSSIQADLHETGSFRQEKREPLSPLRQRIAQRLVSAQQTAAMLTTFNEVDMSSIMELRNQYREGFEKKFGVKLGFMSFFMKAVSLSLEAFPTVNAYIDQDHVVYHNYCDIGVAVSSDRGLVVPVIKNVQSLSFAECEKTLADMAEKARKGKIALSDLQGGTFTITNGGVFGSLLSTPIINPPQSAILGMHKIQERPVAMNGQIVIKPMMYLALSYDHRLIDGAQAVGFLVDVKKCLEHPENFFLNML